jgi:RNA polymerase sigma factor (sigma-70 family)
VHRHGPLVLGVCRRVLGNDHDADDAFQATFLVLASRADTVSWRESIGSWLYNVAYHVASRARRGAARRRHYEQRAATMATTDVAPAADWDELRPILDDELQRLPEKYRMPLLLCCVQGQSRDEAAVQLGWTPGEVKGRLQRGRDLLRGRLTRRGLALSVVALPVLLAQGAIAALPPTLVTTTVQAAIGGAVTAPVADLMKGAVQAMFWSKIKIWVLIGLVMAVALGVSVAGVLTSNPSHAAASVAAKDEEKPAKADDKRNDPRVDAERYDKADLVLRVKLKGNLAYSGTVSGFITTFTVVETLKNKTRAAIDKEVRVNANGSPRVKIDNVIRGMNFDEECTIYLKPRDGGGWLYLDNSVEKGVSHVTATKPKQ